MSDSERARSGVGGPVEISPRGPLSSDRVAFYAYSGGSAYQRTIQSHFVTTEFPELWDWIKEWISTNDLFRFIDLWYKIATDPSVPVSVVQYLATE